MQASNFIHKRSLTAILMTLGVLALTGCSSIGYRCPLDPNDKPDSPTACSGMREALAGAKLGTGGKTSVLLDDKGRIVPPELLENKPATPLAALMNNVDEPYRTPSGTPLYKSPKVYQVWSSAFVDAQGNLHDGHTSWFSTPGQWAYGSVNTSGSVTGNVLSPSRPNENLNGRVIITDPKQQALLQQVAQSSTSTPINTSSTSSTGPSVKQEKDKAALMTLSSAANTAAEKVNQKTSNFSGITAPAVQLKD